MVPEGLGTSLNEWAPEGASFYFISTRMSQAITVH